MAIIEILGEQFQEALLIADLADPLVGSAFTDPNGDGDTSDSILTFNITYDDFAANLPPEQAQQLVEVAQSLLNLSSSATFRSILLNPEYPNPPIVNVSVTDDPRAQSFSSEVLVGGIRLALSQTSAQYGTVGGGYANFTIQHIIAHEVVHYLTELDDNESDATGSPHNDLVNQILSELDPINNPPRGDDYFDVIIDPDTQCFGAGTPIDMWPVGLALKPNADGVYDQDAVRAGIWTKPIEEVSDTDTVVTFDGCGNAMPGRVDKLFNNTTPEFFRLSFTDGRDPLVTTPGHRFLTETGDYMEIGHMLRLGGGTARVVNLDGSVVEATGELIVYSAETAHMFPEAQTKTIAMQGNTVLKEQVEAGWQTYNFEVREHHNYVAGGIRVHNDSVLASLQPGEELLSLNSDLTNLAVIDGDEVVVRLGTPDPFGNTQIHFQTGFRDNPFSGIDATDTAEALIANNPALASDPVALLASLGTSGALPDPDLTGVFILGIGFIQGLSASDIVEGTSGNDALSGTSSADIIYGLAGNDSIVGGDGDDALYSGAADANSYGRDTIYGEGGDDVLTGSNGGDTLYGGSGNDTLTGGRDFSTADIGYIDGGSGNDVVRSGQLTTPQNGFQFRGDILVGGSGNDSLFGGAADDDLTGGTGNDILEGGRGGDVFIFGDNFGNDVITDYDQITINDRLDFSSLSAANYFSQAKSLMTQVGDDVVMDVGGGNILTILDVDKDDLFSGDFIF